MRFLLPLCALSVACTGILEGRGPGEKSASEPSQPNQQTPGPAGTTATNSTPAAGPPFKVRNTEPELVPFDMRLRRIASAIGVDAGDPMFATMHDNALKLGAYDYANGALPDGSWNANRIAAWIDALKPVCNSPSMKAKYPALPDDLPQLIRAAWGHLPSEQDSADFKDAIAASGADAAVVYESTCMAVFSAAELVYR